MAVVGVDGCGPGWYAVVLDGDQPPRGMYLPHVEQLPGLVDPIEIVGIDIPIGYPDETGRREADMSARKFVAARRSSVYPTPAREALEAADYPTANQVSRDRHAKGLSKQSFSLGPKILEVAKWAAGTPFPVIEIHPEVSFAMMAGRPAQFYKKKSEGETERVAALRSVGISVDHLLAARGPGVGRDDIIDAAAAAWSARRYTDGAARSFPDSPPTDQAGRLIAIWA